jgi:predicted dehydrogenase
MIDLARWYMGDVCAVSAHLATFVARSGSGDQPLTPANDMALLLLEMDSGAQASLHISAVGHTPKDEMRLRVTLYGDTGTIEADLLRTHLRGARAGGAAEELPPPDALWGSADRDDPFSVLFSEPVGVRLFLDAAREQRAVRPDFSDGLAAQIVVDAALASHASGRRVAISELAA